MLVVKDHIKEMKEAEGSGYSIALAWGNGNAGLGIIE